MRAPLPFPWVPGAATRHDDSLTIRSQAVRVRASRPRPARNCAGANGTCTPGFARRRRSGPPGAGSRVRLAPVTGTDRAPCRTEPHRGEQRAHARVRSAPGPGSARWGGSGSLGAGGLGSSESPGPTSTRIQASAGTFMGWGEPPEGHDCSFGGSGLRSADVPRPGGRPSRSGTSQGPGSRGPPRSVTASWRRGRCSRRSGRRCRGCSPCSRSRRAARGRSRGRAWSR